MKEVIDFYKNVPFNYTEETKFYTDSILEVNQVLEYKDLHELCLRRKNFIGDNLINKVIEFGCGTGWLTNSLSHIYKKNVTSVDFTEKALEMAKIVSRKLKVNPKYIKSDIFDYQDKNKYDLVISMGVLHHTKNCELAFKKISSFVKSNGYLYVGLYHEYGRVPMLNFMQSYCNWHGEDSAYKLFNYMSKDKNNTEHSFSWFRDQILHPHETQHTLKEVRKWLDDIGFKLLSTSINDYKSLKSISNSKLDILERELGQKVCEKNVKNLEFSPGYFTICAKKVN